MSTGFRFGNGFECPYSRAIALYSKVTYRRCETNPRGCLGTNQRLSVFFLPRSVPLVASYSLRFGRVSKRLCRKLKIIRILEEYGHGIGKTTYHKRTDKWHDILFHIARPNVGTVCTRVCTIALNRISGTIKTKNDVFVYHWRCECARCWNGCYSANRCTGLRLPRSLSEWANGWKSRVLSPWPSWYHPSVCRR